MTTKTLCGKHLVSFAAAAMAVAVAPATTVELTKTFTYGYNFTSGECWVGNIAPQPGYDFHVGNGRQLQVGTGGTGSDVIFNFPGDSLIFGTIGGDGGVFCHAGAGDITINNLTLANGHYFSYYTWSYSGSATLRGSAIITSPESAPFEFRPYSSSEKYEGLNCYMTISGDVGTRFAVTDNNAAYKGVMSLFASSPSYLGSIKVTGGITLGIAASDSLGGKLASFDEDSLLLEKQATLRSLEAGISLEASDNRGMRVASTGGRVLVESGKDMTIGWPISGDGTLVKSGAGTLYISNTVAVAAISLQEGSLAAALGTAVEIPTLVLAGGSIGAGVACGVLSATTLDRDAGAKIPVQIVGAAEVGRSLPFFKAPVGSYTVDDFEVAAGTGTYGEPFTKVTSAVDGADEIFSLQVFPLVTTSGSGASGYYVASDGSHWSDGNPVHANAAYLVLAESGHKYFRAFDYNTATEEELNCYEFPGHSITFAGKSSSARGRLAIKSRTFNGWLRFMDYSYMAFDDIPDPDIYRVTGRIDISANPNTYEGVTWSARNGATSIVESVVSGNGFLYLNNPAAANTTGTFVFAGTNTYTGIISIYGGDKFVCLRISDERNLGANPPTFDETRFRMDAGAILHPIGSVTIDDPNRGMRLAGSKVAMRVDDGETLTLGSPISTYGSTVVTKSGGGTLDFRCPLTIATTFAVAVEEGFVKCGEARKLAPARLAFSDGGGLAVDRITDAGDERSAYGMVLTNAATTFPSAKLKVRIDYGERPPRSNEPVPFATMPSDLAAALGDRVEFVKNTPYGDWALVRDEVALDGAQAVRYSAKFLNGFKVIFR